MRRVVNFTNMSLDGLIEKMEDWAYDYVTPESTSVVESIIESSETMVIDRQTYDAWSEIWPSREGAAADGMNGMTKIVASDSLTAPSWSNTTVIRRDEVVATVEELRGGSGGDIVTWGVGPVLEALLAASLVDELTVAVHPILSGAGALDDLLFRAGNRCTLDLRDTRSLDSGVVLLRYTPHPQPGS